MKGGNEEEQVLLTAVLEQDERSNHGHVQNQGDDFPVHLSKLMERTLRWFSYINIWKSMLTTHLVCTEQVDQKVSEIEIF